MKSAAKLVLGLSILLSGGAAFANSTKAPVSLSDGFVFLPLKGTNATAGYGVIENTSKDEQTLTVVSAEGFKAVELHETVSEKGMMKMKKLDAIKLKAGEKFELKAGGNHIMLFDATKEFKEGATTQIKFKAGTQSFSLPFKMKPRVTEEHDHSHHH